MKIETTVDCPYCGWKQVFKAESDAERTVVMQCGQRATHAQTGTGCAKRFAVEAAWRVETITGKIEWRDAL